MTKSTHYNFQIKNIPCDVNNILQGIDEKMQRENIDCSRIEFNYLSNAIEYLFRSFFKGQLEDDLKKAMSEIQFVLNYQQNKKE